MKETTKKIVSKRLTKVVALVLMCVICTSGVITVTALSRDVTVLDGDKMYGLTTLNANPDAVLDRLGIEVSPEDSIEFDEAAAKITIKRAFDVTVEVDGKAKTVTMTEGRRRVGGVQGSSERRGPGSSLCGYQPGAGYGN